MMIGVSIAGLAVGWGAGLILIGLMWTMNSANKRRWDALATLGAETTGTIVDRKMVRSGKGFSPVYRISYRDTSGKEFFVPSAMLQGNFNVNDFVTIRYSQTDARISAVDISAMKVGKRDTIGIAVLFGVLGIALFFAL
jgi:hypothetical protein